MSVRRLMRQILPVLLLLFIIANCKQKQGDESEPSRTSGTNDGKGAIELTFTYGSEKEKWVEDVTKSFHASGAQTKDGKKIRVTQIAMGSGECMDEILAGKRKAHVTSPASAAFIKLANAKRRVQTGKDLIPTTENLVLSPVVIAM